MQIDLTAPVVPAESLGGLQIRTHVTDIDDLLRGIGTTSPGTFELVRPYEARFSFGDGSVEAAVDIRNGRIFKLIGRRNYKGCFGAVALGMIAAEVFRHDSRFFFDDAEGYFFCKGVPGLAIELPDDDPDPQQVLRLPISAFSVYAPGINTADGQGGNW
jgi:hypothetical protein